MPEKKTRRERMTEAIYQEIKDTAFEVMREKGTNGLSVREIARRIEMSASAFYHYFSSLDVLITALIVDSFKDVAEAIAIAKRGAVAANKDTPQQLHIIAHAFRRWALDHTVKFQLIYGTPISGYAAPPETTVPYVQQIGVPILETLVEGIKRGEITPTTEINNIPNKTYEHYRSRTHPTDEPNILAHHILNVIWQSVFGLVMLEVNNHLQPGVGDTETFFDYHVRLQLKLIGIKMS